MIDLHSHTIASDGTLSPAQLITHALNLKLESLAITDHDTFEGFDKALPLAQAKGLDLVCGIEVSTRFRGKSVHLLGYFLKGAPDPDFREWLLVLQDTRRERNKEMIVKLNAMGIGIRLEEVEMIGRSITGRPHFARALVQQGYCKSIEEAWVRSGGTTRKASRQEVGALMLHSATPCWEDLRASPLVALADVQHMLDLDAIARGRRRFGPLARG